MGTRLREHFFGVTAMPGQDDAIATAKDYAAKWDIPWGTITSTQVRDATVREFSLRFWKAKLNESAYYTFTFQNAHGVGVVEIFSSQWGCHIQRFEFYPESSLYPMLPLWAAYPQYNSVTSGWRQGYGEVYKYRWYAWYRGLSDEQRSDYKRRFPPSDDPDLCWDNFYEFVVDTPADPDSVTDFIFNRIPK